MNSEVTSFSGQEHGTSQSKLFLMFLLCTCGFLSPHGFLTLKLQLPLSKAQHVSGAAVRAWQALTMLGPVVGSDVPGHLDNCALCY